LLLFGLLQADPHGPTLIVTSALWRAFTTGVQTGAFDLG
jgi:hypothetical protein